MSACRIADSSTFVQVVCCGKNFDRQQQTPDTGQLQNTQKGLTQKNHLLHCCCLPPMSCREAGLRLVFAGEDTATAAALSQTVQQLLLLTLSHLLLSLSARA